MYRYIHKKEEKEVDKVREERREMSEPDAAICLKSELTITYTSTCCVSQQTGAWALSIDKVSPAGGSKEALAEAQTQNASRQV